MQQDADLRVFLEESRVWLECLEDSLLRRTNSEVDIPCQPPQERFLAVRCCVACDPRKNTLKRVKGIKVGEARGAVSQDSVTRFRQTCGPSHVWIAGTHVEGYEEVFCQPVLPVAGGVGTVVKVSVLAPRSAHI